MIAGLLAHVKGAATGGGIQNSGYGRDQVSVTSDYACAVDCLELFAFVYVYCKP